MQSQVKLPGRPEKMTILSCAKYIYQNNGLKGFYRGVTPRIGLGVWQTVCMVFGGDAVKVINIYIFYYIFFFDIFFTNKFFILG